MQSSHFDHILKSDNNISVRPYTRSVMTNYNAMQKVFRSRKFIINKIL